MPAHAHRGAVGGGREQVVLGQVHERLGLGMETLLCAGLSDHHFLAGKKLPR